MMTQTRVPFLVSCLKLDRPVVGDNLIQVLIRSNASRPKVLSILSTALAGAMGMDDATAGALVSFIQAQKPPEEQYAAVKVGLKEVTILAGHVAHIKCKVPPNIDPSDPVVLFKPTHDSVQLDIEYGGGAIENSPDKPTIRQSASIQSF